jgi:hypothetical protein
MLEAARALALDEVVGFALQGFVPENLLPHDETQTDITFQPAPRYDFRNLEAKTNSICSDTLKRVSRSLRDRFRTRYSFGFFRHRQLVRSLQPHSKYRSCPSPIFATRKAKLQRAQRTQYAPHAALDSDSHTIPVR